MQYSSDQKRVLEIIKQRGPISVAQIKLLTGLEDKPIRNAIDAIRRTEAIWLDKPGGGFWWSNDPVPKSGVGRWHRAFEIKV